MFLKITKTENDNLRLEFPDQYEGYFINSFIELKSKSECTEFMKDQLNHFGLGQLEEWCFYSDNPCEEDYLRAGPIVGLDLTDNQDILMNPLEYYDFLASTCDGEPNYDLIGDRWYFDLWALRSFIEEILEMGFAIFHKV